MIKCGCELWHDCFTCKYPAKTCDSDRKPKGYFCIDPVVEERLAFEKTEEGKRARAKRYYERQKNEGYR